MPPLRLISRGALNVELEKLILANVRTPDERKGDLGAQLAATLRATERLKTLARRYGGAELIGYMAQVMDYSERLMRASADAICRTAKALSKISAMAMALLMTPSARMRDSAFASR